MCRWWPIKAVTFVDNHDTGSSQNHWPFPADQVMQGYAYIMTHPGAPCIFWVSDCHENLVRRVKKCTMRMIDFVLNTGLHMPLACEDLHEFATVPDSVSPYMQEHYFDWGLMDGIKQLVDIRKRNGIKADSSLNIWCAEKDMYVAEIGER